MFRNLVLSLSTLLIAFASSNSALCAEPTYLSDPAFGPYLHDMSARIRHGWDGSGPRDVEHGPVVRLRVYKSGLLLDAYLWHHSGFKNLDQSFLDAVWNASPFRPFTGTARPFMDFETDHEKFAKTQIIQSYGEDGLPANWTQEKTNVDVCTYEAGQLADVIIELSSGKHEKGDKFFRELCDPRCVETVLAFNIWHKTKQCVRQKSDEKLRDFFEAIPAGWLKSEDPSWEKAKSSLLQYIHNLKTTDSAGNDLSLYRAIGEILRSVHSDLLEHRITTLKD